MREISKAENNILYLSTKLNTISTQNKNVHNEITELRKGKKRRDEIIKKIRENLREREEELQKVMQQLKASNEATEL